ncbi:MAG: DUF1592 domain-containing protein [Rubripirellula sp.]|nr:DUF1592 domain-containing protein [Rubripirellula sp.]
MKRFWVLVILFVGWLHLHGSMALAIDSDHAAHALISQHCLDCHQGDDAESGIDLEGLLKSTASLPPAALVSDDVSATWAKVEKVIKQGRMPPSGEDPINQNARQNFLNWFHERIVLKNGETQIGPTPLRRLTHYEFLNSLEDLLGVTVRPDYNFLSSVNVERGFVEKLLPVEVPGKSGFVNDANAMAEQPLPLLEYMKCVDFALSKMNTSESALEKQFGFRKLPDELNEPQIRFIAEEFLHRALRGKNTDQHTARAVATFQSESRNNATLPALKSMLRTILLSPEFFYRLETTQSQASPYQVSDVELATRLSFFLHGSTPDQELLAIAETGTLKQPDVLEKQVTRLLNQPRRISLSERFAAQWLGFEDLISDTDLDERGVPTINRAQYDEMLYFFDELFRSDLSLLNIVESDWAYVSKYNQNTYGKDQFKPRQAFDSRYTDVLASRRRTGSQRKGIENIYDPPTLYTVLGDRYGGIITSAAVMRTTSAPERTSPVRRGVWLLDKMIGEKLEAPKNVPPITNAIRSLPTPNPGKLDIIKAHTEMESCQICHKDIDPIGFGLENFGPSGRWRTTYRDKSAVLSEGVLPGGTTFSSPKQLKQQLLETYRENIVRNFIQRLLAYAIGRSLQPHDRVTVDQIYQRVIDADFRSGVVIREIVRSQQFLCRQDNG